MKTIGVELPTPHADQLRAFALNRDDRGGAWEANAGGRFKVGRCGRRWGKTEFGKMLAARAAISGKPIGWFAPTYKYISEVYAGMFDLLLPVRRASNKTDGVIRTISGGQVDFWTLEDERAGRSRKYAGVIIDEAAFTGPGMVDQWEKSIKPTLLDYGGWALVISNTNGVDPDNFLYAICNDPKHGFIEFHAPSMANPNMPERWRGEGEAEYELRRQAEIDELRERSHPLVFQQEYLADFVDWSGVSFFGLDKLLDGGLPSEGGVPVAYPTLCDSVFAVVDSATKTGTDNDGTAVSWWALNERAMFPLIHLDWDITKIMGALLPQWLPGVFERGEELARLCCARFGFAGVWIEDKDSGQILLQHAKLNNLKVHAIDGSLTALGKDGRAINASSHVHRHRVKLSQHSYDKTTEYNGSVRNHLVSQVTGFRVGEKEARNRADDLLDTFTYGVSVALGGPEGLG